MPDTRAVVEAELRRNAEACVEVMGDVFWDFRPTRDGPLGYRDPRRVALESIHTTLQEVAARLDPFPTYSTDLAAEYHGVVAGLKARDDGHVDTRLRRALVEDAGWTADGASTIVRLAREHGVFVLRNALALAAALGIEDGLDGR